MRTYTLRFLGMLVTGVFHFYTLSAQNPVFPVRVREYPLINPTVYLSDLSDMPFNALRPMYELTLLDPVESSREVYFRVSVQENGAEIMRTNPNIEGLPRFTITRGAPRLITGMDLAPYLDLNNLLGRSGLNNSNILRPGMNAICIEVMDALRQEPISAKRCASGFWSLLDPPLLALPANNATIAPADLASQLFTWQMTDPRAGAQSGVRQEILFDFELRELPVGMNPQDAFDNFIQIYSLSDQIDYLIFYNQLAPLLEPGKTYAWRVRAKRVERGQVLPGYFKNNGFSMVHTFKVSNTTNGPTNPGSTPGCECVGANCIPSTITDQTAASRISPGQTLKMGFFQVTDLNLTNNAGASLSGTGMVPLDFMNFKVKVFFNGLQVNSKGEVFGGAVRVDRDAASNLAVQAASGAFSGIPLFTEADKQLLSSIVESNVGEVPKLPFSIRKSLEDAKIPVLDGPGDLIVSDLYFSPQGAFMDLIAVIPDGNGNYVRFGASKVGLRPEGIDMSQLLLFLADDLQLPGLGDVPLYIKKAINTDSISGSYMSFDCNGFKKFNLVAEYIFPKEQLIRADEPLQEAVKASLVLTSSKWGQFIATAGIPKFKLADAPEWSFEVKKATMDLDSFRNVDGMIFPTFYAGEAEAGWKGFYIKELSVTLPPEFRFGDTSQAGITISANNLLIDTSGVSGDLFASNVFPMDAGEVAWGFSLDTIGVYFAENAFRAATINGGAKVGILGADIRYDGVLYEDEETQSYAFDLVPRGIFDIEWLQVKATIGEDSYITIRKPDLKSPYRPYAEFNMLFNFNIGSGLIKEGPVEDLLNTLQTEAFSFGIDLNVLGIKINHPDLDGPPKKFIDMVCMCGSSMYVNYGKDTLRMAITDILKSDSILNLQNQLVPGFGLEFEFDWLEIAGISLEILAEENERTDPDEFPGFQFPRFKLNFDPTFIDKIKESLEGIGNLAKNFRCQCEGETSVSPFCAPPGINGVKDLSGIAVDANLEAAHFPVKVTTWGTEKKGKVNLPLLGISAEVDLTGMAGIDQGGKLTQGRLSMPRHGELQKVNANVNGGLDFSPGFNLETLLKVVKDISAGPALVTSLPFSLKKQFTLLQLALPDSSDILVTDLYFTQDRAAMDILLIMSDFNGGYLRFGASGIRIRPDGIDLGEMLLFLAEDMEIPGLKDLPLRIKKSENADPKQGSFISFDCKGFKEFNLVAEYTFDKNQLVSATDSNALVASVQLRGSKWGQFLASASIPEFRLAKVEDWSFKVISATMDLDSARNVDGMVFPTFYSGEEEASWKGFYIEELSVTLPPEFRFGDKSKAGITISANNLLIDTSGVSGDLFASNVFPMDTGEVAWGFSLDTIGVYFSENTFRAATINGGVKVGILGADIRYDGVLYEEEETKSYAFDLVPRGIFDIEWLKVKATIGEDSYITIRKPDSKSPYRPYAEFNLGFNFELTDKDFGGLTGFKNIVGLAESDVIGFGINVNVLGLKINHPDLDGPPKKLIDMVCMCGSAIYLKYGTTTHTLTVDDILKSDSVMSEGVLVPGFGLEFIFKWPGLAEISMEVSAKEETVNGQTGYGAPGFKFSFKIDSSFINAGKVIGGTAEAFSDFSCRCPDDNQSGSVKENYCDTLLVNGTNVGLSVGEIVKVGHFSMKISSVSNGGGKGSIRVPFLNSDLDVTFGTIEVVQENNGGKFLKSGTIETASREGPKDIQEISVDSSFLKNISAFAANLSSALSLPFSVRDVLETFNIELPGGSDFIFLGLTFTPEGATANAMIIIDIGTQNYLKFGISGLKIRPDGMNMESLKVFLADDFSF
jgi:hypothetical protein